MKRFAVYARYSSDNQKATSAEDQIRECTKWVHSHGGQVCQVYQDHAESGAHFINRSGIQQLLRDAELGKFDGLIAEDLSRLSRDQEHIAGFFKRLNFYQVKMYTISDNEVSALHIGLKGTVNQIYLSDLADKTRRGQKGSVERGKIPGGLSFGYRKIHQYDASGEPVRGLREIHPEEADVIRRIFKEFILGKSPRAIAADLNREGVPSPRGGEWMASTINGNPARQNGILCNMLYTGRIAYNRQRFIKNPETGKRRSLMNPPEEWVIKHVEELRIVSDEDWDKVQSMKRAIAGQPQSQRARKRHLFSGLIRCAECGGAYTVCGKGRYACSHHRERGTCSNGRTIQIKELENRVLRVLEHEMLSAEMVESFTKGYQEALESSRNEKNLRLRSASKELAQVTKEIDQMIRAIMDGLYSPSMKETLPKLENRKLCLVEEIKYLEKDNIIEIKPKMAKRYFQEIQTLTRALKSEGSEMLEARNIIRSFVDAIIVTPGDTRGENILELRGDLANILCFASGQEVMMPVVAGVGFVRRKYKCIVLSFLRM